MNYRNYRQKRSIIQKISINRINTLFKLAYIEIKKERVELVIRYIKLALKIATHYRVKIPDEYKHSYCKTCHIMLIPGKTAQVRLKKGKVLIKCLNCNNYRRFIIHR